jgi:3-oxoacyl-[acyl-carrier-protein] synthase-3
MNPAVRPVGLLATASYLPDRWMSAEEIAARSGIKAEVIVERFGLRGKHIAAPDEHVSDLALSAARRLLDEQRIDPGDLDAIVYCGSTWKDYAVWQAAPHIAHRLGAHRAFTLELDYVSCGAPVALRVCRSLLAAGEGIDSLLLVAASRESYLLDYGNARSRFMITFGDGAVAALLIAGERTNELLGSATLTDGSYSLDVKVPAGGSVEPASLASVEANRHFLDVPDPISMKERLDPVTLPNFLSVARAALRDSGVSNGGPAYLCPIHVKRSLHEGVLEGLGLPATRSTYLDDTGHMSGVDPLLAFDRACRQGAIGDGEIVLLLAAGTGYTWAASTLRAGPPV